jgi:two-component system, OmpR family, phosphate regulon sensor histidine kinase PhoR
MADTLVLAGTAVVAAGIGAAVATLTVRSVTRRRAAGLDARAVRAERALKDQARSSAENRQVQDTILATMEEGVLLLDPEGRRVFANEALERHLGAAPDSVEALLPLEIQRAAKHAGFTGSVTRAEADTGAPVRWLRAAAIPVGDDGSVLVVVRDVTEARRLDRVRRDFVANASHELKTPVASIRAAAETLRAGAIEDPPAARRFTEQLEREALRLSRIVSDLLDLSRLETGSDLEERIRVDAVAAEEVQRLQEDAREAGVALELHADGVPSVHGSSRDLALLVRNLVDNAVRYTQPGGSVDVTVTGDPTRVLLRVTDTGLGIPQRDTARIFERFYRVDRARSRETGGTGLGLAIVKHVAENHRAEIDVRSELGRGTTFEVSFPVTARSERPVPSEATATAARAPEQSR